MSAARLTPADLDAMDRDADEAREQSQIVERVAPHDLDAERAILAAGGTDLHIEPAPVAWFSERPPRRRWLLRDVRVETSSGHGQGVLPRGRVGIVAAAGGAGKTTLATALAVSLATCTPLLGAWVPSEPGRALLLLGEEDTDEAHRRLHYAAHAAGVTPPAGAIDVAALAGRRCSLLAAHPEVRGEIVETAFFAALLERVARERYALIILDPLARFGGADAEVSSSWATRLIEAFEALATASDGTLLCMHHTSQWSRRKGAADRDATISARGHTALTDGARWVATLDVEHVEHADPDVHARLAEILSVRVTKSNYGRHGEPIECRRGTHGELVALDEIDRVAVELARAAAEEENGTTGRLRKSARARDELRAEREARERDQKAAREAEQKRAETERLDREDETARAIVAEMGPDLSHREWRAQMRARLGSCGGDRADAARVRLQGGRP